MDVFYPQTGSEEVQPPTPKHRTKYGPDDYVDHESAEKVRYSDTAEAALQRVAKYQLPTPEAAARSAHFPGSGTISGDPKISEYIVRPALLGRPEKSSTWAVLLLCDTTLDNTLIILRESSTLDLDDLVGEEIQLLDLDGHPHDLHDGGFVLLSPEYDLNLTGGWDAECQTYMWNGCCNTYF